MPCSSIFSILQTKIILTETSDFLRQVFFLKSFNFMFIVAEIMSYLFCYKTDFSSFQNNPKNLDPSYKMDLDLWDCLERVKLMYLIISKIHRTVSITCGHLERGKPYLIAE